MPDHHGIYGCITTTTRKKKKQKRKTMSVDQDEDLRPEEAAVLEQL